MSETATLENTTRILTVHDNGKCIGEHCTIHNRSNHSMRTFPQNYRWDAGFMERICPHGIGHPDPDEINQPQGHGCDGCCAKALDLLDPKTLTPETLYELQSETWSQGVAFENNRIAELVSKHRLTTQTIGGFLVRCSCTEAVDDYLEHLVKIIQGE